MNSSDVRVQAELRRPSAPCSSRLSAETCILGVGTRPVTYSQTVPKSNDVDLYIERAQGWERGRESTIKETVFNN